MPAPPAQQVAGLVRANALRWRELNSAGRIRPGQPDSGSWSSLEYAAHVRDVYRLYRERVRLMLDQDDPLYPNWDQDRTAVDDRYEDQDPDTVVQDLSDAAEAMAATFDAVTDDQWDRPGRRSDGAEFTVASISRYLVHDPVHHLWDVERAHRTG